MTMIDINTLDDHAQGIQALMDNTTGLVTLAPVEPRVVFADVGNVWIAAEHHGMGWRCLIDGKPVQRMRKLTLTLEVDKPNLLTLELLPDHRRASR